jgi:hypothetical protein
MCLLRRRLATNRLNIIGGLPLGVLRLFCMVTQVGGEDPVAYSFVRGMHPGHP